MEAKQRIQNARIALEGLSVGDALGDQFFVGEDDALQQMHARLAPNGVWKYTDDTLMTVSVYDVLRRYGEIDQDALAESFAKHLDKSRGYGAGALRQLIDMQNGADWQSLSSARYGGIGSAGNGSAMRVAPIGAYFYDDIDKVVEQTRLSSEITHMNIEAIAGAVAVAVATSIACKSHNSGIPSRQDFIAEILEYVPERIVKAKLVQALNLPVSASVQLAVSALGNGSRPLAVDTVPFAIWCAGGSLGSFEEAFWLTLSGLGDRDTNCAIACGIVACSAGVREIPASWVQSRENLPDWIDEPL